MNTLESQRELRYAFLGGFAGQLVSGVIWLLASAISVWGSRYASMAVLFGCSMFIFPLTKLVLRLFGQSIQVSDDNHLWGLGWQTAFTVPLNFLLVGAAAIYRENWFFPAAMIVVGAHYLPFITLYGMKMFASLSFILVFTGTGLAFFGPDVYSIGGWFSGVVLILFGFIGQHLVNREKYHIQLASNSD